MMEFLTYNNPAAKEEEKVKEEIQQPENEVALETEQLTHTVVKGETLWGLSRKYLGAGYKYKEIMKENGLKSSILYPGMVLKIPEL
jgi:nucleoid-associated protein YgaU